MILVTGATGRLGGQVVRALRRLDFPVRALVRTGSEYFWLNDTGCSYFFGDLRDPRSLRRACAGVTHVVAASGVDVETRANDHTVTTVEGHRALFTAAAQRGVQRVVYVSALGVDRGYPIPWFDARRQAEEALQGAGVSWTALRPAPFTRTLVDIARRGARRGRVRVPGPADNLLAPVSVRWLALLAVAALDAPGLRDRTVDVAGSEAHTAAEVLELVFELAGGGGGFRTTPRPVAAMLPLLVRPAGRRWSHRLAHRAAWFTDAFVAPEDPAVTALGVAAPSLVEAIREDLAEVLVREDPSARDNLVVHRRLEASVYRAGRVPLSELPDGPLSYDQ